MTTAFHYYTVEKPPLLGVTCYVRSETIGELLGPRFTTGAAFGPAGTNRAELRYYAFHSAIKDLPREVRRTMWKQYLSQHKIPTSLGNRRVVESAPTERSAAAFARIVALGTRARRWLLSFWRDLVPMKSSLDTPLPAPLAACGTGSSYHSVDYGETKSFSPTLSDAVHPLTSTQSVSCGLPPSEPAANTTPPSGFSTLPALGSPSTPPPSSAPPTEPDWLNALLSGSGSK